MFSRNVFHTLTLNAASSHTLKEFIWEGDQIPPVTKYFTSSSKRTGQR